MPVTTDLERLALVAGELGVAVDAAQAGKRVRLPVIQRADAAGLMFVLHAQLDDAIEERSAEITAAGSHLACSAGCSACCVSPLLVSEGEAVAVAEWLAVPAHAEIRAAFVATYPAWRAGVGDAGAALERARTQDDLRVAAVAFKRRAVMCAFNRGGLCSIYDARPARCRRTHALESNAHCGADSDGQVQYFEHLRTEATFEEQEPLRAAVHQALRRTEQLELLCSSVSRLLGSSSTAPGRNDLCTCGSGKKYKKCCGA